MAIGGTTLNPASERRTAAKDTLGNMGELVKRAESVVDRLDGMLHNVTLPEPPMDATKEAVREMVPPLFDELNAGIDSVHYHLSRIERLMDRCGL